MSATTDQRRVKLPLRLQTRRLRTLVRCCAFVVAVLLLVPLTPWPLAPWPWATMVVPACSSFVTLATVIATRSLGPAAMVGLPILLVVLVRRRWFCRWLCPVGLLSECAGRLSPVSATKCQCLSSLGKAIVLLSLAAACFGYPLLLWLDPLAIFTGLFGLGHASAGSAAMMSAGLFAGLIVLSGVLPGAWCLKCCPLGATQDLLAMPSKILLRHKKATNDTNVSPEFADTKDVAGFPLPRRTMLAMAAGTVCAGLGVTLGWGGRCKGGDRHASLLRPPGAVPAWQFPQLCLRCGNCVRACQAEIIRIDQEPDTLGGWLTPIVVFETDYCREDCNLCMRVCPSGAIVHADLEEKRAAPIGLAHINMDRCIMAMGPECRAMCMESCPYEAIQLHEWSFEDDRRYPIVENSQCPGCGACAIACTPMNAIVVRPLPPMETNDTQDQA